MNAHALAAKNFGAALRRQKSGNYLIGSIPSTSGLKAAPSLHAHDSDATVTQSTPSSFTSIATANQPVTDKIAHGFGTLYDAYFTSSVQDGRVKLLEIGLGCDMTYGPGASSKIWPALFPKGQIWLADVDGDCVKRYWNARMPWQYVTGDQSKETVLNVWLNKMGDNFDFIIDDGAHTNAAIWTSFQFLFYNALKPGGVYFIEDLHVNKADPWYGGGVHYGLSVIDILQDWMQQLVLRSFQPTYDAMNATTRSNLGLAYKTELPQEVHRIDCVQDMCAITKRL